MTWWLWVEAVNSCALPSAAFHDDVIKWQHFPRYWPFVRGIHRSPVNSPRKGQWRGALMFSLICARINGWVNNRKAGDLRRHRAHYDVTVMSLDWFNPWWRHAMETVYALLTLCDGNPPITGGFPHKGSATPLTRALIFSLMLAWTNGWINRRVAGELRRHGTHCNVIVIQPNPPFIYPYGVGTACPIIQCTWLCCVLFCGGVTSWFLNWWTHIMINLPIVFKVASLARSQSVHEK